MSQALAVLALRAGWCKVSSNWNGLTQSQVVVLLYVTSGFKISHFHVIARPVRRRLAARMVPRARRRRVGRINGEMFFQVALDVRERRTIGWILVPATLHQRISTLPTKPRRGFRAIASRNSYYHF